MTVEAGRCTKCGHPIWASVPNPDGLGHSLLWPYPWSVYAVVETPLGPAPGIGFCRDCAPAVGAPFGYEVIVRVQGSAGPITQTIAHGLTLEVVPAPLRYGAWYTERHRLWLAAWLTDHCKLPDGECMELLARWRQHSDVAKGTGLAQSA